MVQHIITFVFFGYLLTQYSFQGILGAKVPEAPTYIFTRGSVICSYSENTPNMTDAEVKPNCFWQMPRPASSIVLGMVLSKNTILVAFDTTIHQFELSPNRSVHDKMLTFSAGVISALSVDWIAGNIYYADQEESSIRVVNLDGSYAITVVDNIDAVRGMAVDPIERNIFWTITGSDSKVAIGKSNLDGSSRNDLFYSRKNSKPFYLCMDHLEKRLYWSDHSLASIESISVDGTDHQFIMTGNANYPYTLTVNSDHVVWTENLPLNPLVNLAGIYWTRKSGDGHSKFDHHLTFYNIRDIIYFGEYAQPSGHKNKCSGEDNGGCSHICFPTSKTERKCRCALGYVLGSDAETCHPDMQISEFGKNTIFVADSGRGTIFAMDTATQKLSALTYERESDVSHIIIDPVSNVLIWNNHLNGTIRSSGINNRKVETVKMFASGHRLVSLTAIPEEKLIVYSDLSIGKIDSITYDGKNEHNISVYINNTWSVVADVDNKYLYLSVWGVEVNSSEILRVDYNGQHRTTLVDTFLVRPRGLCIDFDNGTMYWADTQTVERATTDGLQREKIYYKNDLIGTNRILAMAISGDYLYVVDFGENNQLKRIQRHIFTTIEKFGPSKFLHTTGIFAYPQNIEAIPRITQRITSTTPQTPETNGNLAKTSKSKKAPNKVLVIAVTVGVVGATIVIIVVGAAILCRRKRQPPPSASLTDDNAFENPGYVSTMDLSSPPAYPGYPGNAAGASAPPVHGDLDKEQLKLRLVEEFSA